jgi:nicotinamidase-related amidase
MTHALIVVDIQNDYFPGGAMELVGAEKAASEAALVKREYKALGHPVFMVQHVATSPEATFFKPNTKGVEIHDSVALVEGDVLIVKNHPNAFLNTNLLQELRDRNVSAVTIVGMMTHMCIDSTVRAASDLGFKVVVVGDACATKDLQVLKLNGLTTQQENGGSYMHVIPAADIQAMYLDALRSFATVM